MRRQFIKFNIDNDLETNHDNDINTIVKALEEVCTQPMNDMVEGFIKEVDDDIIGQLTACAEIVFEAVNWGRIIVFISFVRQLAVHYRSKPEIVNLIFEWLISYFETQLDSEGKNAWSRLKGVKRNNNWLICAIATVGTIFFKKMTIEANM